MRGKKIAALATAALLGAGGVVAVAAPALAHTGDMKVTAVCNTETGNYDVKATLKFTSVPAGNTGKTKARVGDTNFDGTPTGYEGMYIGPISSNGNVTIDLTTFTLPGDTTGYGPWVYAYTKWSPDNFGKGSDGRLTERLKGDCKKPDAKDAVASVHTTPATCDAGETLVYGDIQNAVFSGTANGTEGPGKYNVKATANDGHRFADNTKSKTFKGDLAGKITGKACTPEPERKPVTEDKTDCDGVQHRDGTQGWQWDEAQGKWVLNPADVRWGDWTKVRDLTTQEKIEHGCYTPPTNQSCPTVNDGGVSTEIAPNGWTSIDTRSAGHYEYVENGLHIWTDDATGNAKVSLGKAVSFPLKQTGQTALDYTATEGIEPGVNLFVDFDNDGSVDGTLVWEAVYGGTDYWLTNGSKQFVKDAYGVKHGGGYGSVNHGEINDFLISFPDAQVTGIAFSLGSGVKGVGTINSITVGCSKYTFDRSTQPAPRVEHRDFENAPDCETATVTHVYQSREFPYVWGGKGWVEGEPTAWKTDRTTTRDATIEECPAPPLEDYRDHAVTDCDSKEKVTIYEVRFAEATGYKDGEVVYGEFGEWEFDGAVSEPTTEQECPVTTPPTTPTPSTSTTTTTVPPTTITKTVPPASPKPPTHLAFTGTEVMAGGVMGALLLAAGVLLLVFANRRREGRQH